MEQKPTAKKSTKYKVKRIIGGTLHNVLISNDKIVEDFGPVKKDQPEQENTKTINDILIQENEPTQVEEQKNVGGLQLVDIEEQVGRKAPTKISGKKPSWEDILNKIPEPDPDKELKSVSEPPSPIPIHKPPIPEPPVSEPNVHVSEPNVPVSEPNVPVSEPPISIPIIPASEPPITEPPVSKPSKPPEIKIPKIKIPIKEISLKDLQPKDTTYPKIKETEVVGTSPKKADEDVRSQQLEVKNTRINTSNSIYPKTEIIGNNLKFQQPKVYIQKPKSKERKKPMEEESLETELLTERKFEEWIKKQKFRENLEKAAKYAEETKQQFEEKIPELSEKIEGITGEVKGVEDKIGLVDKSVGDLCTGVNCIKDDVKKYQDEVKNYQDNVKNYQDNQVELEKMVQDRFRELGEKVQGLEHPTFTCENCGDQVISPLSSFCPNCGSPIHSWSDETGEPIRGWSPYWKRMGRESP